MGKKNRQQRHQNTQSQFPSANQLQNGLGEAVGYTQQGNPFTPQISQSTTIFRNLRWYMVSNMRQMLSQAYVEIGLIQTIVDVPVDDALRGGVIVKSKQLDESEIQELMVSIDRDDDLQKAGEAAKWNRLYGGAGIIVMVDDQDPELPLELDSITDATDLEFRPVDMWELFYDKQNADGYDPSGYYNNVRFYNYYGEKIHASRVMPLKGITAPSFIRPRLRGWGVSIVETLVRSINQYIKATDLSFEVLDEFKLDVYKLKNLVSTLLSPGGEEKVAQRVRIANYQKNYQNAIVMDSEDDYDHKQLSFAGLAEAMSGIRMQVASDLRIPITKLFGISATGFNSGEDDIEVYNSMVESQVRSKLKYHILKMLEIKCQKLFGYIPEDLAIEFKPLRILSAKDEEDIKAKKFERLIQAKAAGEISTLEFRDACNRGGLFDIQLDTSEDVLTDVDEETADIAEGDEKQVDDAEETRADEDEDEDTAETKKTDKVHPKVAVRNEKPLVFTPPKPYTGEQFLERYINSNDFDLAAYKADGGDNWIDPGRKYFFENPVGVHKVLWASAVLRSKEIFGSEKWQFVAWYYRKMGGRFDER